MKALIAFALAAILLATACSIHPDVTASSAERLLTITCFVLSVVCAWIGISNTEQ